MNTIYFMMLNLTFLLIIVFVILLTITSLHSRKKEKEKSDLQKLKQHITAPEKNSSNR